MLQDILDKLSKIKSQGYIKSFRKGPTGIGYTLESLLDISENNLYFPDIGEIEIKALRDTHSGLTTLFTFNKKAWKIKPLEAIKRYGSMDKNGRMGLYYTMSMRPNSAGLYLYVDGDTISIRSIDGTIIASWQLSEIARRFKEKLSSVLLVNAKVEIRDDVEYFYFHRARLLTGNTSPQLLRIQFEKERIMVDLRLHEMPTRARNHGTGFRILEKNLEFLFTKVEELEI